jgi:hypothetical protein
MRTAIPDAQGGRGIRLAVALRRSRGPAVLFCAVLLLSTLASSQAKNGEHGPPPYALIFGTVWTPDGRPIGGVPVSIRPAGEKKAKWRLVSDHQGEFAQRVPAGKADYVVWADIKMPKGESPPEVRVQIEKDERIDIGLHLTPESLRLNK